MTSFLPPTISRAPSAPALLQGIDESIPVLGVTSAGMARIPYLGAMLGAQRVVRVRDGLGRWHGPAPTVVAGWGRKPSGKRAEAYAEERGIPCLLLEDGFLRSVGLGVEGAPPLSVAVDDRGAHYDATAPSRLEFTLSGEAAGEGDPLADPALLRRAEAAMAAIVKGRISKYNRAPDRSLPPLRRGCRGRVLVVDQTAGDLSIALGCVPDGAGASMVRAALEEHPAAEVVVQTHPDVLAGKRQGALGALPKDARVRLHGASIHPAALLEQVDAVYTMTSLLGFEALLRGLPVSCFGMPFYAGWGLTDDRVAVPPRRGRRRSLSQVFAAAYLLGARYVDPEIGERCEAERVIEHLALQRRVAGPDGRAIVAVGMSRWKRAFVSAFLGAPMNRVKHVGARRAERALRPGRHPRAVVVWGPEAPPMLRHRAQRAGAEVWRMEDGFLRSVGLGADLHAPLSLVIDRRGMYFDPSRPSDLEHILEHARFSRSELERAARLREALVRGGITKYNVGEALAPDLRALAEGRRVALVVGQVEDDASIARGCVDVRTNRGLLEAAREAEPDAFLVYKPHPDVWSGNRRGAVSRSHLEALSDAVVTDASVHHCLDACDVLHTLTSLAGFEALLREREVVVHGLPFYAGWGLTCDRHRLGRRTRALDLDSLVAGVLIRYPRYVHPRSGAFTTPEAALAALCGMRDRLGNAPIKGSYFARRMRKARNLLAGLRRAP